MTETETACHQGVAPHASLPTMPVLTEKEYVKKIRLLYGRYEDIEPVQDPALPPVLVLNMLGNESSRVITTFLESQRFTSRSSGSGMITSDTSLTTSI